MHHPPRRPTSRGAATATQALWPTGIPHPCRGRIAPPGIAAHAAGQSLRLLPLFTEHGEGQPTRAGTTITKRAGSMKNYSPVGKISARFKLCARRASSRFKSTISPGSASRFDYVRPSDQPRVSTRQRTSRVGMGACLDSRNPRSAEESCVGTGESVMFRFVFMRCTSTKRCAYYKRAPCRLRKDSVM